ncbi:protein-ribulosamine 3-kinase [Colletotrichum asianum]|uniref:Protein-ribulosamine 3-kinase n=1 Tax=Colletotrichum asianum TaxID=702518 RepID=A0A8H3VV26_9PEZI|nr:protein-ribulosamine 3-kinase [Colletotrichum asianum]
MDAFYEEDMKANGSWSEYERAFGTLRFKVVVPQLLDALQSNGRQIKPCLVDRDLWEENAGISLETGIITLFDASCRYHCTMVYRYC